MPLAEHKPLTGEKLIQTHPTLRSGERKVGSNLRTENMEELEEGPHSLEQTQRALEAVEVKPAQASEITLQAPMVALALMDLSALEEGEEGEEAEEDIQKVKAAF